MIRKMSKRAEVKPSVEFFELPLARRVFLRCSIPGIRVFARDMGEGEVALYVERRGKQ